MARCLFLAGLIGAIGCVGLGKPTRRATAISQPATHSPGHLPNSPSIPTGHSPLASIAIDASAARASLMLAQSFARVGEYAEAIQFFEQTLAVDPFCGRAQVDLAQVLLMQGAGSLGEVQDRQIGELLRSAARSDDVDVKTLATRLLPLVNDEFVPIPPAPVLRKRRTHMKN